MRNAFQLTATATLLTVGAVTVRAQITSSDVLVGQPPQPREYRAPRPKDNLQWMWSYTREPNSETALNLRDDARFKEMLRVNFTIPELASTNQSLLKDAIPVFLMRYSHISSFDNRYITIDGCVPRFCPAHGMLFVDLATPDPLIVFVSVNWTTEGHTVDENNAGYDLSAYANRPISAATIPSGLVKAVAAWDVRLRQAGRIVPHIAHAVLVNPDNAPLPVRAEFLGANRLPPQTAVSPADGAGTDPDR